MTTLLLPMLATQAKPFDNDDYLFEIKWDGIRALAASEGGGHWRLWGRAGADYTLRYPELAVQRYPNSTLARPATSGRRCGVHRLRPGGLGCRFRRPRSPLRPPDGPG